MAAAEQARQVLGIYKNYYLGLPDNRLDSLPLLDVIQPLERVISEVKPEIIYTHHYGDLNVDHQITHQAVMTACRPMPGSYLKEIYTFEVMSSTEWAASNESPFFPNYYVDIGNYLDVKLKALNMYIMEMREEPHSRSIKHIEYLARHRGSTVGVIAAEAFMAIRILR